MAIYVEHMSGPTAGGGIRAYIDTESWQLITVGMSDLHEPVADRQPLMELVREWLLDPPNVAYDGRELAHLILQDIDEEYIPVDLLRLLKKTLGAHN